MTNSEPGAQPTDMQRASTAVTTLQDEGAALLTRITTLPRTSTAGDATLLVQDVMALVNGHDSRLPIAATLFEVPDPHRGIIGLHQAWASAHRIDAVFAANQAGAFIGGGAIHQALTAAFFALNAFANGMAHVADMIQQADEAWTAVAKAKARALVDLPAGIIIPRA